MNKKIKFRKRRLFGILLLLLSLAGAGCGSGREPEEAGNAPQTGKTDRIPKAGTLSFGYFYGEDGIALSSYERFLYSDWNPVEFDYICMDPTCSHQSGSCSARTISNEGDLKNDFSLVYQDRLIIVHADSQLVMNEHTETVEDWSDVYQTDVYEADLDGSNRRKKVTFPGAIASPIDSHAAVLLDGKLYFGGPSEVRWRHETEEDNAAMSELWECTSDAVYCLNLNDYTLETFAVMEENEGTAYQYQFYEYDGMIYAAISNFQDDHAVWYRIDPAAGECREILRFDSNVARFCGAIGDTVYYEYENSGKTLYARDIASDAEEREFMTVNQEDMRVCAFILDGKILFQTEGCYEGEDRMAEYALLDKDGNLLDTIRYDDYITFLDVVGDKLIYFRMDSSDWEHWWADKSDIANLPEKGMEIGPFLGSSLDTLMDRMNTGSIAF